MNETVLYKDDRFTLVVTEERHILKGTNNDCWLKSGSLQDCVFWMEQLKAM